MSPLRVVYEENYLKRELYALIREEEQIFDFIQKSALDGLWFWDLEKPENEWMNPKFWTTLGYDPEEMPHQASAWQSIINQEDLAVALENFNKHCEDPHYPYDQVVRYQHKLGHTVWIHCRGIVIRDKKGKPYRMLGAHTDITKLKKTEIKLRRQISKYEHIIEGTSIGTWEWNIQTGQIIFNERWAQILGYALIELDPVSIDTWNNSVHPDDRKKSERALQDYFEGKTEFYECETRMRHKNGDWVWVLDRGKIVSHDKNGDPEWMLGSHQEITQRKKDLQRHKVFIEQAPSAIAMLDTNMCYISHSKKWLVDYKIKDEDIIGKSHYDIFPEIGDTWKKDHQKCLEGNILRKAEDRFERTDGSVQWISWELHPWYKDNNKVGGLIMLTSDITRTKEAEIELKISEKKFRANFENAATGMAILDLSGQWLEVNNTLCKMVGYTPDELKTLTFQDITHPDDLEVHLGYVDDLVSNKISFCHIEKRYLHKNGDIVHAQLSVSIVRDENDNPLYFVAQITDITPRVQAQNHLERTLTKLESVFEASTQVSIIGTNTDGLITSFNRGAENLLGYKRNEVIGKQNLLSLHALEEIQRRGKELSLQYNREIDGFDVFTKFAKKKKHDTREWNYIRKDGSKFPVQLTITAIKEKNRTVGYLAVAANISEIKKVETEIKSLLAVANGQNRRLKNFAHIVSHNLKSHSGNFSMLLDLYLQENPDQSENEILSLFREASNNLSETIDHLNQVVLMSSKVEDNLKIINLEHSINKVVSSVKVIAEEAAVRIENLVSPETNILGIPAYMDSIILNFITNSIKYRSQDRDSYVLLSSFLQEDYVVLVVEDNGLGIDLNKHHSKLFGMYKTFHRNKDARGIGLFITKNQVEALGGKIEVESQVNKGTTFKIYLKYEKD
ncbi:PAS domain S-box protein [Aquimarina celericrescens]|nr:PAS domain S-box protein [Aquimarina celericrescens]